MKTILLRSAWQTVNIGDIAHTPGMLHLFEKYLPGTSVILWPGSLDRGVEAMLRRRFPALRLVRDASKWKPLEVRAGDPTIAEAMEEASVWVTGSGSGVNEQGDLQLWRKTTGKPYGVIGASVGVVIGQRDAPLNPEFSPEFRDLLDNAAFLYTRETTSLGVVKRAKIKSARMDFVPDATFALDLFNPAAAKEVLREHGLEADKFICVIPRSRITPYWEMGKTTMAPEEVARRHAINEKYKEADCAKMREVIVTWVRQTGNKVLLCPEMTYQMLLFPLLFDPLPGDVKPHVKALTHFWITDEAASVYQAARAVVSMDCHSPIIANAVGRPGFYLRQPEDTWKGQMYPDLGLGDWKFEIEEATGTQIAERLMHVHTHYSEARETVRRASKRADDRYRVAMKTLKSLLA